MDSWLDWRLLHRDRTRFIMMCRRRLRAALVSIDSAKCKVSVPNGSIKNSSLHSQILNKPFAHSIFSKILINSAALFLQSVLKCHSARRHMFLASLAFDKGLPAAIAVNLCEKGERNHIITATSAANQQ
jgi:hypothetical protein